MIPSLVVGHPAEFLSLKIESDLPNLCGGEKAVKRVGRQVGGVGDVNLFSCQIRVSQLQAIEENLA